MIHGQSKYLIVTLFQGMEKSLENVLTNIKTQELPI